MNTSQGITFGSPIFKKELVLPQVFDPQLFKYLIEDMYGKKIEACDRINNRFFPQFAKREMPRVSLEILPVIHEGKRSMGDIMRAVDMESATALFHNNDFLLRAIYQEFKTDEFLGVFGSRYREGKIEDVAPIQCYRLLLPMHSEEKVSYPYVLRTHENECSGIKIYARHDSFQNAYEFSSGTCVARISIAK